ncbi:hypothetical protein HPHPH19_1238 [Helicobacter pylori Hp H-19]|nr:hypothetical protein HPHPH19_1238 [Helicobacter pylori Hp H-19]
MHHFLTITDGGSISNLIESNPTPKPLTSQEDLLKQQESLNEFTKEPTHLSPLEQVNA